MPTVEITPQAIQAAAAKLPQDGPITMVNLLRYNRQADYPDGADLPRCTGREAYFGRYVPAFNEVAAAVGATTIKVVWVGQALTAVVAPGDESWDDVAVIEYPDFATFRRVVESPGYLSQASPHRQAALADWRLIATVKLDLPG